MSEVTTEFTVEPFKITVSARGARSDGNYGSDEVFASVQQSIPDKATAEQIEAAVAFLAEPLKAAVEAALPEQKAPVVQSRPASGRRTSTEANVEIKAFSRQAGERGGYVPIADAHPDIVKLFAAEGDTSWVVPQALALYPWATEVIFAQKQDKSGTYFQARGRNGEKGYVNKPEGTSPVKEVNLEEPF